MMIINRGLPLKLIFWGCLVIFCLLLYKDPFSQRTLIPNFEPFPDTFHYILPAINLVHGEGFVISREGRVLTSHVGPLYALSLIPFFLINDDPRFFYFTNVVLALLSFVFFYKILRKITDNSGIILTSLFIYVTNYYLYWYPTLAMAENLTVLLFIIAVYLLFAPVKLMTILLATILAFSFFLNKYASAPLTLLYILIYGVKVYKTKTIKKYLIFYCLIIISLLLISLLYLLVFQKMNIALVFVYYLKGVLLNGFGHGDIFSLEYLSLNLSKYLNTLIGGPTKVLWESTPILPQITAIFGITGLLLGTIKSNHKFLCISLFILLAGSVFFMSTFYSFDARYLLHAIPALIIGVSILLVLIEKLTIRYSIKKLFCPLLFIFLGWYLLTNAMRLKNQIMLNLKYAETPWYYISVLEMNKFFTIDKIAGDKKPIIVSAMTPFLIDFFSNNNYTLLPLSYEQEFRSEKEIVWGPNDYSDLPKLYTTYLKKGYPVYLARYGLGNEFPLNRDYKIIEQTYKLEKVATGCYEQCNIYKIDIRDDLEQN